MTPGRLGRRALLWAWAIGTAQHANGLVETSWAPHIPVVQAHLGINDQTLGWALFGLPLGLVLGAIVGTRCNVRFGSRITLIIGAIIFFGVMPFAPLMPRWELLAANLWLAGFGNGFLDCAWALQATSFEDQTENDRRGRGGRARHAVQGFQVLFSLGSVIGAVSGALAIQAGWGTFQNLVIVCGFALVTTLLTVRHMPKRPEAGSHAQGEDESPAPAPTRANTLLFVALCVCAFLAFFPLGVTYGWSTKYLVSIGAHGGIAAFGLIAYTASEMGGCLLAWLGSRNFGRAGTGVLGAMIAFAGGIMIVSPGVWTIIVGFGLVAFGFGPATAILQSRANELSHSGNRAVRQGILTNVGYVASTVGQPLIGQIAGRTSLRIAMGTIALAALVTIPVLLVAVSTGRWQPFGVVRIRTLLVFGDLDRALGGNGSLAALPGHRVRLRDGKGRTIRTLTFRVIGAEESLQHAVRYPRPTWSWIGRRGRTVAVTPGVVAVVSRGRVASVDLTPEAIRVERAGGAPDGAVDAEILRCSTARDPRGIVRRISAAVVWLLGLERRERAYQRWLVQTRPRTKSAIEITWIDVELVVGGGLTAALLLGLGLPGWRTALAVAAVGTARLLTAWGALARRRRQGRTTVNPGDPSLVSRLRWAPVNIVVCTAPAALALRTAITAARSPWAAADAAAAVAVSVVLLVATAARIRHARRSVRSQYDEQRRIAAAVQAVSGVSSVAAPVHQWSDGRRSTTIAVRLAQGTSIADVQERLGEPLPEGVELVAARIPQPRGRHRGGRHRAGHGARRRSAPAGQTAAEGSAS